MRLGLAYGEHERAIIAVNATNLHVGGGVQVAVSFLSELAQLQDIPSRIAVYVSTEVDAGLKSIGSNTSCFASYHVFDVRGIGFSSYILNNRLNVYKIVFTVFGPIYGICKKFISVVGFAQPWIIYPNNECYPAMSWPERLFSRLKYTVQGWFFRNSDVILVELDHVKEGLIKQLGIDQKSIYVIHNTISTIYNNPVTWKPLNVPHVKCDLRVGFLGRNYRHKNTAIFLDVARLLQSIFNIKTKFYVTFTQHEWLACSEEFRDVCVNVGPLAVNQCPTFYNMVDCVVFPSLLECFSATPLEAMAMGKILFASDRPFNRDICGDHAIYFDPLSADSAARVMADVFLNNYPQQSFLEAARNHAISFSSANVRAMKYLEVLTKYVS
jgi:glycosyltransferase involved in cell wall biosynthesis